MRKTNKSIKNSQVVMMIHPEPNNITPILPKGFDPSLPPLKARVNRKAA